MLKSTLAGLTLCTLPLCALATTPDAVEPSPIEYAMDSDTLNIDSLFHDLGEITVTARRPAVRIKKDALMVDVKGTYLANSGTTLQLLGKMPFVTLSGSELEVIGRGTPVVYINGRRVRDLYELQQLPSSSIKSVEVITNPGSRYDATVNAVIRVTTIAPVGEGFSLSDRTIIGYKHYAYIFEQLNLNWRRSGLDLFANLNYENYRERPAYSLDETQYLPTGVVTTRSSGRERSIYPVYRAKAGFNYTITAHTFGLFYDFSFRPSTSYGSSTSLRSIGGILADELTNTSNDSSYGRQHLLSGYYNGTFGNWQLDANIDVMWKTDDSDNLLNEQSTANPPREFTTHNDVANRLIAANLSASRPVWKGRLNFGAETSDIDRTDRYNSGSPFITPSDTHVNETIVAAFADISQQFGPVNLSAGLRYEYTNSRFYLYGVRQPDESRREGRLFPSATVAMPVGAVNMRLSYSRKTSRPSFGQLNSAIRYKDRYTYESGNPYLHPILRDNLTLTTTWRDLAVELDYTSTDNYFMWQTVPYPGNPDVTLLQMQNMPRFNTFSAMANYAPTFGCWHPVLMAAVEVSDFNLVHAGSTLHLNRPIGVFRFNNAVHLPWDMWLNADLSCRTAGDAENLHVRPTWQCNLALYKAFANDTWTVRLSLDDVFATASSRFTIYDAISANSIDKHYDTRDLQLTVTYRLNPARSKYRGRGASPDQRNRL